MSYATPAQLIESTQEYLVAQLTGSADTPDETIIERALDNASAEIDGYIGSRYNLPLPSAPEVLKHFCIDIALYRMMSLRPLGDIEDARKRYEDAIRFLKDLIRGEVSLGLPEAGAGDVSVTGIAYRPGSSIMKGLDY